MDTKEIKGGRDEFVIVPPGNKKIEIYQNTGNLKLRRKYNSLSDTGNLVSDFQILTRAKRWAEIPGLSEIQNIVDQVKEIFENPLSFVMSKIPSDLSSFKDLLGKLEDLGEFVLDNALKKISEELSKMEFTEEELFQVTFFRSMDPTSLDLWRDR